MADAASLLVELGCEELPQGACAVADANAAARRAGCSASASATARSRCTSRRAASPCWRATCRPSSRRSASSTAARRRTWPARRRRLDEGRRGLRARATASRPTALELRDGFVWVVGDAAQAPDRRARPGPRRRAGRRPADPQEHALGRRDAALRAAHPHARGAARRPLLPAEVAGVRVRAHAARPPRRRAGGRARRAPTPTSRRSPAPASWCRRRARTSSAGAGRGRRGARGDLERPRRRAARGRLPRGAPARAGRLDPRRAHELPDPVLVTAMQSHQRYLPLAAPDGSRYPGFLTMVELGRGARRHRSRRQRARARGRLDDAAFSLEQDLAARAGGDGGLARPHHLPRPRGLAGRPHRAHRARSSTPCWTRRAWTATTPSMLARRPGWPRRTRRP